MDILLANLFVLYLFLPTFIANGLPVVAKNIWIIKKYSFPVSEKLFGKNKTYRGFIAGIWGAIIVSVLQFFLTRYAVVDTIIHDYYLVVLDVYVAITVGILQWFWALAGDAIKSFFKRRIWKKPGEPWFVFDGIDYIVWSLILFSPIYLPSPIAILILLCVWPLASGIANIGAYIISWKEVPY